MALTPDGLQTYVSNGGAGGLIRATDDPDGSNMQGLGGDDSLRGGKYDDSLDGGAGNDSLFGGLGNDIFKIDISDIVDGSDTDKILDLTFTEEVGVDNDILALDGFAAGTFVDALGANALGDGGQVHIRGWTGLHNAMISAINAGVSVSASQMGSTNALLLVIDDGTGHVQNLVISNGYSAFMAAGGLVA
ncbi:hypothetical protein OOT33_10925 [Sphingobium sp. DEHP117]|uniref:hypothetical protein n=1 Tax=Sphingobium sp. DEHP117 TaxID=2993436 RepID=UPI0027D5531E|nr:hypothetical protein [Sphingobium sp. DEHP117]MDQ4420943.1 hypothetical protein [Sphingobium sp. DEHP117]